MKRILNMFRDLCLNHLKIIEKRVIMNNNRYSRAKIYKLIDNTNNNIYVGSTCENRLCRRLQKHLGAYKSWLKGSPHQNRVRSFDILKNDDYKIILLENYPCETKEQLLAREQYYIDSLTCINKNNTYHNSVEYKKKWDIKNKEKLNCYNRIYRYSLSVGYINKIDPFLFL